MSFLSKIQDILVHLGPDLRKEQHEESEFFTSWGRCKGETVAHEAVVNYREWATMKALSWDQLAWRGKNVDLNNENYESGDVRLVCWMNKVNCENALVVISIDIFYE